MTLAIVLTLYTLGLLATGAYVTSLPEYAEREHRAPIAVKIALVGIMLLWPFYWGLAIVVARLRS